MNYSGVMIRHLIILQICIGSSYIGVGGPMVIFDPDIIQRWIAFRDTAMLFLLSIPRLLLYNMTLNLRLGYQSSNLIS